MSMEACNSLVYLKFGVLVWPIFTMLPLQKQIEGGVVLGHLTTSLFTPTLLSVVEPSTIVLLTLWGVLFACVLYRVITEMNSCITGVLSACGACINPVLTAIYDWLFLMIIVSAGGTNTGTTSCLILIIRLLNNLCWEIPAGSPVNWTCISLAVALFEPFPTSFVAKFATFSVRFPPIIVYCQIYDFVY